MSLNADDLLKRSNDLGSQTSQASDSGFLQDSQETVQPSASGDYVSDLTNTILSLLNYELSGVKMSVWLTFLVIGIVVSYFIWRQITKAKTHHDLQKHDIAKNYLQKAGDFGRKPMPFFVILLLLVLVFIEASGFSYVLGDLFITNASAKMLDYAALFGGILISVILMFMAHFSGEELYKNNVLKAIEHEVAATEESDFQSDYKSFKRNEISMEKTTLDDNSKTSVVPQLLRIHQKYFNPKTKQTVRKKPITLALLVFVLVLGIGAMLVRFYVFDRDVSAHQKPSAALELSSNAKTTFRMEEGKAQVDDALPSFYQEQAQLRDKYKRSSEIEAQKRASYITYFIMTFIFFAIQIIGVAFSYRYGFIGLESKAAYKQYISYKEQK